MTDHVPGESELLLYQTEDGRTRIQCRFQGGRDRLADAGADGKLLQKDMQTINEHLVNIFDEGELRRDATIRKLRIVRNEGKREVMPPVGRRDPGSILDHVTERHRRRVLHRPPKLGGVPRVESLLHLRQLEVAQHYVRGGPAIPGVARSDLRDRLRHRLPPIGESTDRMEQRRDEALLEEALHLAVPVRDPLRLAVFLSEARLVELEEGAADVLFDLVLEVDSFVRHRVEDPRGHTRQCRRRCMLSYCGPHGRTVAQSQREGTR